MRRSASTKPYVNFSSQSASRQLKHAVGSARAKLGTWWLKKSVNETIRQGALMEQTAKTAAAVKAQPRVHYGFVVLIFIVLAVFGALGLARFGYTSILPAMQDGLKLSNTQTGELQSWNLLGYMLTVVFAGVVAARYGPRAVISISLVAVAAAMLATGLF